MKKIIAFAIFLSIHFMAVSGAKANDGQWPEIFELIQNGQDVEVVYSYYSEGCAGYFDPSTNAGYLYREKVDSEVVFIDEISSSSPMQGTTDDWSCPVADIEYCASNDCVDCDGDETPECPAPNGESTNQVCCYDKLYTYIDECVSPGQYVYTVYQDYEEDWANLPDWFADQENIKVVDTGDECLEEDTDTDSGSDTDSDTGSDTETDTGADTDVDTETDTGSNNDAGSGSLDDNSDGGCTVVNAGRSILGERTLLNTICSIMSN